MAKVALAQEKRAGGVVHCDIPLTEFDDIQGLRIPESFAEARRLMIERLRENFGSRAMAALIVEDPKEYREVCLRTAGQVYDILRITGTFTEKQVLEYWEAIINPAMKSYGDGYLMKGLDKYVDPHTGLLTRAFTEIWLKKLVEQNIPSAILSFDLENLGAMNTALGPELTDVLMRDFFKGMNSKLRLSDIVVPPRFSEDDTSDDPDDQMHQVGRRQAGGDEGQIPLPGVSNQQGLHKVISKIYEFVANPIELEISKEKYKQMLENYISLSRNFHALKEKQQKATKFLGEVIDSSEIDEKTKTVRLKIRLDMRFSGSLIPANTDPQTFNPVELFKKLEVLEELAKKERENSGLLTPAVVDDGTGKLFITGVGQEGFVPMQDRELTVNDL